ncbi:DMT family transporter [Pseudomonas psychrophila]|uniref:DMT family transporter n=1 Tax=Pseudomonas psychrophila TaxID=122355 RepID=UPI0038082B6E
MHTTYVQTWFSSKNAVYAKLVMVSCLWGGTFVAGRYLAVDMAPLLSACLRFLLASLTLVLMLGLKRNLKISLSAGQCLHLAALGFFGVFAYNLFFFYGLHFISSSRASLIVALNPALIALTAFAISRERLRPVNLAGIVLCIAGASTVIISKGTGSIASVSGAWRGDVLILGCVMSWVIYSVFARRLVREIGPLHTVAYSVMAGSLMLFIAAIVQGDLNLPALSHIQQTQWLSLIYLGVLGSALAYIWYYDGIQKIGVTQSGSFIALNPLSAVVLGMLVLGERLSLAMVLGGVLAITGIVLCNRSPRPV